MKQSTRLQFGAVGTEYVMGEGAHWRVVMLDVTLTRRGWRILFAGESLYSSVGAHASIMYAWRVAREDGLPYIDDWRDGHVTESQAEALAQYVQRQLTLDKPLAGEVL